MNLKKDGIRLLIYPVIFIEIIVRILHSASPRFEVRCNICNPYYTYKVHSAGCLSEINEPLSRTSAAVGINQMHPSRRLTLYGKTTQFFQALKRSIPTLGSRRRIGRAQTECSSKTLTSFPVTLIQADTSQHRITTSISRRSLKIAEALHLWPDVRPRVLSQILCWDREIESSSVYSGR